MELSNDNYKAYSNTDGFSSAPHIDIGAIFEEIPSELENEIRNTQYQNNWIIVMFYNPTCPHCIKFNPIFMKYAEDRLYENTGDVFVKVDGIKYNEVVDKYSVDTFPSVQMFSNGQMFGRQMP